MNGLIKVAIILLIFYLFVKYGLRLIYVLYSAI